MTRCAPSERKNSMTYICLNCGKGGLTSRHNQKFCGYACRDAYRERQRRKVVQFEKCRFNQGVECNADACDTCGWNPKVEKRRKGRLGV